MAAQMPPNMAAMMNEPGAQPGPQGGPGPQPAPQEPAPQQPPEQGMPDDGEGLGEQELQAELVRGIEAVGQVLYETPELSDKILSMASAQEKIGSVAKAVILTVTQVDKKIDLDEEALAGVTVWTVGRLLELVQEDSANDLQYSEKEAQQVMMTSMEMLFESYGVTTEDRQALVDELDDEEINQYEQTYKETLNG